MNAKLVVIILNWNGEQLLERCLSLIVQQCYDDCMVVVADNFSQDNSVRLVREKFPSVDVFSLPRNEGFSRGNNLAICYALSKYNPHYVLLMNNDVFCYDQQFFSKLIRVAQDDAKAGIVSAWLNCSNGVVAAGTKHKYDDISAMIWLLKLPGAVQAYEVDSVVGAVFLIKREVIDRIGLLDEGYSPFFFEDFDYCQRARVAGWRVVIMPADSIEHVFSESIKKIPTAKSDMIFQRNCLRFVFLHAPLRTILKRFAKDIRAVILGRIKSNVMIWAYWYNVIRIGDIIWKRCHPGARLWF